jgi:hypothetical protein
LRLLTNLVTSPVYTHNSECKTFDEEVEVLKRLYCKPVNEVFARHKFLTRKQNPGENIDQFLEELRKISKECNFNPVSAERNRDD